MSSKEFSDSEDIFDTSTKSYLEILNIKDFTALINQIIINEKIRDGTEVCFKVFLSIMAEDIHKKVLDKDYHDLTVIVNGVKLLKNANKFNSHKFLNYFLDEFLNIPLEIVWWLHKTEIIYFLYYCNTLKPVDLADSLLNILKENKNSTAFEPCQIVQDLLLELIRGCYRPKLGICRLYRSKDWSIYCSQVVDNMLEYTVEAVVGKNRSSYVNFLPLVRQSAKFLPSIIIKRFFKSILNQIMTWEVDELDLFTAYTYQELWTSENISEELRTVYNEIFTLNCELQDIMDIMEEHDDSINWKFTLAAISICVRNSPTGGRDARATTLTLLNASFTGGKIKQFVKGLLLIRQSCMEKNMKMTYQTWYSSTFGIQSNYQPTTNVTLFKFVMSSLTSMIPYEPKSFLNIHIENGLSAPPKNNYLIHDYKNLCRARLQELRESSGVFINGVEVKVLHIIEESSRNECVSRIMLDVINHQYTDYIKIIVPQVLKNKMPNTKVKDILYHKKFLSNKIICTSHADIEGTVFDEDDDFVS